MSTNPIQQPGQRVERVATRDRVTGDGDAFKKYQSFFVGSGSLLSFIKYELAYMIAAPMPGALGLVLRKAFYPRLLKRAGKGAVFGRNVQLRHPNKITFGKRVAIDDNVLLDAKDDNGGGLNLADDVVIARDTLIQCKGGPITMGEKVSIGTQGRFSSTGGIRLGRSVMIADGCLIGGGRYRTNAVDTPISEQEMYTFGELVIEDGVWIGNGVIVQDGVRIGQGSVIGAGAVIKEDVPPFTIVVPHQRLVMLPRDKAN